MVHLGQEVPRFLAQPVVHFGQEVLLLEDWLTKDYVMMWRDSQPLYLMQYQHTR
jgi:hypothetical protein